MTETSGMNLYFLSGEPLPFAKTKLIEINPSNKKKEKINGLIVGRRNNLVQYPRFFSILK